MNWGTLMEITELSKTYDNGEMDIKTKGQKIFRILEVIKEIPEKLFSGAIVNYPANIEHGNPNLMQKVINAIAYNRRNTKRFFIYNAFSYQLFISWLKNMQIQFLSRINNNG